MVRWEGQATSRPPTLAAALPSESPLLGSSVLVWESPILSLLSLGLTELQHTKPPPSPKTPKVAQHSRGSKEMVSVKGGGVMMIREV